MEHSVIEAGAQQHDSGTVQLTPAGAPALSLNGQSRTQPARFSVFIPVWNEASWLGGAIESVLAQTYPHWELVIGDNASTEDLAAVVARYPDPRIRYHRWGTHVPVDENFNRTLTLCRHDWLQVLCADDRLEPDCLEQMAERISEATERRIRLAAVIGGCRRIDAQGAPAQAQYSYQKVVSVPDGVHDAASWLYHAAQPGIAPWNAGAVAMSREVLAEMGGFYRPDVGLGSDVELVLRAAVYGDIWYISQPLLRCTVRTNSVRTLRAAADRGRGDPFTPMGGALLYGLRAHESRRVVGARERRLVASAIARSHLQRAIHHRYYRGGGGRRAALADIGWAVLRSPRDVFSASFFGYAATALLAPQWLILWGREWVANRRHGPGRGISQVAGSTARG